jgi:alpha-galactosidase
VYTGTVNEKGFSACREWFDTVFGRTPAPEAEAANPYGLSFDCDGTPSRSLLGAWKREVVEQVQADRRTRTVTYTDPQTGLELRIEAALYTDHPALEYVGYLKNTGKADTPILASIQALDTVLALGGEGAPVLYWALGAVPTVDGYAPRQTVLAGPDDKLEVGPGGGKSSYEAMPYFNLARSDGGIIAAIGWTGEWAARFVGGGNGTVSCRIGQARSHLRLHPGEEIRTPRIALLFYQGDRWDGQNVWRRFVLAHHRPTPNGQRDWMAPITCGNWGETPAAVHLDNIENIVKHNLPIEYYWIDAGWFGKGGWWTSAGDWEVKKDLYPQGFRPLADRLAETGRKLLLWFEPERVHRDTPWWREHSEWLLQCEGDEALVNLGNPDARRFVTDFISNLITDWGIGCYRQDFNMFPLPFWNAADAPDRIGMTEIRHVEGLYAFWDELLARYPGLVIDNCASGGMRLDLEMLHRATPLWRIDGPRDLLSYQCHTWGLAAWVPLSAACADAEGDDYDFRSTMCSALALNWWSPGEVAAEPIRADFPYEWARGTLRQYLDIRRFYYGDYYPLTPYSQQQDVWMVYQLALPESGECLIVALRRPQSPYERARFNLRGLEAAAMYVVEDLDSGASRTLTGEEMMRAGLEIELPKRPGSALIRLRLC